MQSHDGLIEWGGFRVSPEAAGTNFLIIGARGSGTTLIQQSLMASVLPQLQAGTGHRAVVFDSKGEILEFLKSKPLQCPVHHLNPFGDGGMGWDIAADWTDPSVAALYAAFLIPESSSFFGIAATTILQGVLTALMLRGKSWTFDDLFNATSTPENLRLTLESTPQSAPMYKAHLGSAETFASTFIALQNAMGRVWEIAGASRAIPSERLMRLSDWSKTSDSILVVETDIRRETASRTLNSLVFKTLSRLALGSLALPKQWTTWFFLDEDEKLPGPGGLPDLLARARQHGVQVVLSISDIERLDCIYGMPVSHQMLDHFSNRSVLHLASHATAQWASAMTSGMETFEYRPKGELGECVTADFAKGGTATKFLRRRPPLLASEFTSFPLSDGRRVRGCHVSPAFPGAIVRETIHPSPART